MKLESVTLHNFGSHADTTWELDGVRLAAVVGANRSGKSTMVVDAPLFALYDDALGGVDEAIRIGQTEASVAVEFTFAGARYRAVRIRSNRGAGKTDANLSVQAADGSWTAMASGAKEVPAEVRALLRMDRNAFRTAVVLAQGDAYRFINATPGKGTPTDPGRAATLQALVVHPAFARGETKARDEAKALETSTAADRATIQRLGDAMAELEPARIAAESSRGLIHVLAKDQTTYAAERDRIQRRLTELAGEIAKGDAAAAEVARLEAEREGLADRYRREKVAVASAGEVITATNLTLVDAGQVLEALDELPLARDVVADLEGAETEDRRLAEEIRPKRLAVDQQEREHSTARAGWTSSVVAARELVQSLEAQGKALEPVICEKCHHPNVVDQADIRGQLSAARARVKALEAEEPREPMSLARDRAAVVRLEERRREVTWDPQPLRDARAHLEAVTAIAGRQEAMTAARAARTTAEARLVEAEAELVSIQEVGEKVAAAIAEAKAKTAGVDHLMAQQADQQGALAGAAEGIRRLEERRREAERALATADTHLERLAKLTVEREALTASIAAADVDLACLRELVAGFGVTGIPARIVETVLPELSTYANDLLGELLPGAGLEIRAQRAKADGKGVIDALDLWIRDEAGERSLARLSGAERTSVSLAIAFGLSRLAANRSGAPVRTLIVDEPDGFDADTRRRFGQALKAYAHRGELERVIYITHQPDLADFADEVYQVTKSATGSAVEQVA